MYKLLAYLFCGTVGFIFIIEHFIMTEEVHDITIASSAVFSAFMAFEVVPSILKYGRYERHNFFVLVMLFFLVVALINLGYLIEKMLS